jgi:hypothetical protein
LFEFFYRNDYGLVSKILLAIKEFPCGSRDTHFDFFFSSVYFGEKPLGFFYGVAAGGIVELVLL